MAWCWNYVTGSDHDPTSASMQVNFPAQLAVAQCSITSVLGAASVGGGINGYGTPGSFAVIPMNDAYGWPPLVSDPQLSSVTAFLDADAGDQGLAGALMTLMVSLWT